MRWIGLLLALIALVAVVFALWPGLDLVVAHQFYDHGGFAGHDALGRFWRDFFRVAPFVILALYLALYALARAGVAVPWAPSGRGVIFLIVTMAIGPGLIVNLGLKDHAHRPRPVHVAEFGGGDEFRPWYNFDGACGKNCSFPSGEAASGFWMAAPAILLPPPVRTPALVAAFVFGAGASLLRLAFGGHFLSDVLFGGLIALLVIAATRRCLWPRGGP
jgi:membrane-associated PAP2 superfamily phosphatase